LPDGEGEGGGPGDWGKDQNGRKSLDRLLRREVGTEVGGGASTWDIAGEDIEDYILGLGSYGGPMDYLY